MPRYEYACECNGERNTFILHLSISEYKSEMPCICGKEGIAKRVFDNSAAVHRGLTANEKRIGTTKKRKEMGEFMKGQREVRKKTYGADTREGQSNELWTGKEGLDGVTSLPVDPGTQKKVG
jgi:hypothetical protein